MYSTHAIASNTSQGHILSRLSSHQGQYWLMETVHEPNGVDYTRIFYPKRKFFYLFIHLNSIPTFSSSSIHASSSRVAEKLWSTLSCNQPRIPVRRHDCHRRISLFRGSCRGCSEVFNLGVWMEAWTYRVRRTVNWSIWHRFMVIVCFIRGYRRPSWKSWMYLYWPAWINNPNGI